MKKILLFFSSAFLYSSISQAQTNVSGGIYSNTTWTLANSPYIVVDTVVVFPNVSLTIEPGVTVKFANDTRLEIRQAILIAEGTLNDSITFTSNSSSPSAGIWVDIFLNSGGNGLSKFKYCNIEYAKYGLDGYADYQYLKNSAFRFNDIAITSAGGNVDSCLFTNNTFGIRWLVSPIIVTNSRFTNNQTGIDGAMGGANKFINCLIDSNNVEGIRIAYLDSVLYCVITGNTIGLEAGFGGGNVYISNNIIENNSIGIQLDGPDSKIVCNKICSNTIYDLKSTVSFSYNTSIPNNYWCTPDSASTELVIYDGYDDINLGIVYFMPLDTVQCYLGNSPNGIIEISKIDFSISPNPFSTYTTLQTDIPFHNATFSLTNCFGQTVKEIKNISGNSITLSREDLKSGIYFLQVISPTSRSRGGQTAKLVVVDE